MGYRKLFTSLFLTFLCNYKVYFKEVLDVLIWRTTIRITVWLANIEARDCEPVLWHSISLDLSRKLW